MLSGMTSSPGPTGPQAPPTGPATPQQALQLWQARAVCTQGRRTGAHSCVCASVEGQTSLHFFTGSKKVPEPHLAFSRVPDTSGLGSDLGDTACRQAGARALHGHLVKGGNEACSGTWPLRAALCSNDQEICQYLHMGTAGPVALGQHAQSLFGFFICKRRVDSELWPSACSSQRAGLFSPGIINGSHYKRNKENTMPITVARELSATQSGSNSSATCLWVGLGTSWSLSFLIHKVGSIPPSHRTAAGPAEASAALCGPQGAPGTSLSPLGARRCSAWPDSVSFVPNRIRSVRLGNLRLSSATLGDTALCSASSALFGSVRVCSAPLRAGHNKGPAPARRVRPHPCASGFPCAGPEAGAGPHLGGLAGGVHAAGSGLAEPWKVRSEAAASGGLFPGLEDGVGGDGRAWGGGVTPLSFARRAGHLRGEGASCCTCFPEPQFPPLTINRVRRAWDGVGLLETQFPLL